MWILADLQCAAVPTKHSAHVTEIQREGGGGEGEREGGRPVHTSYKQPAVQLVTPGKPAVYGQGSFFGQFVGGGALC